MGQIMLVTGASRGIGRAVAEHFRASDYQVITVARTGDVNEQGDLTDGAFRKHLVEKYTPDVFVNNAGILDHQFMRTFETNVMAAGDLLSKFYKKMPKGDIVNISSIAANKKGWEGMPDMRVWYLASKKAIKDISNHLNASKQKPIRVTSVEPDHVDTTIGGGPMYNPDYANAGLDHFAPMPASYIAEVIEWIINQPPYVIVSSIEISNLHRRNANRK